MQKSAVLAVLAVALLAVSPPARAETRGWVLCTPGAFHSCHSVALTTTPVMTGSVRTGTVLTITLHNLQGQSASDNTLWSRLDQVTFTGPGSGPTVAMDADLTGSLHGGATGAVTEHITGEVGVSTWIQLNPAPYGVGGCAGAPLVTASTCGTTASVSFSLSVSSVFDASAVQYVYILATGSTTSPTLATDSHLCSQADCDVISEFEELPVTVPEPVSIVLLGTGLLGVGVVRRRRRRDRH